MKTAALLGVRRPNVATGARNSQGSPDETSGARTISGVRSIPSHPANACYARSAAGFRIGCP